MDAVDVNHTQLCGGHVFVSLDDVLKSEVSGPKHSSVFDAWELWRSFSAELLHFVSDP